MRFLLLMMFCSLFGHGQAQSFSEVEQPNIIPNPSFEKYSATPIGWFYKGQHFTNLMKFWSSPTAASPDVFGPKIRVPNHWTEKGFGDRTPHSGESMIGLTLYGCDNGKPHCREYIQIQLSEPLVVGQKYYFEFWTSKLDRSLEINNIGAYFSKTKISKKTDVTLSFKPEICTQKIVATPEKGWVRVAGRFTADFEADYLMIGNFYNDTSTVIAGEDIPEIFPYAYYYFDDVMLRKEYPIVDVPIPDDDLTKMTFEEGKTFQLKNIYFDSDKFELLPRSFIELQKLTDILLENPEMIIEISGHTDNEGKDNYNLYLSRKRAKAVVAFLTENGISKQRTRYKGFGEKKPIADNDSDEGRKKNRRVEMLVVKM